MRLANTLLVLLATTSAAGAASTGAPGVAAAAAAGVPSTLFQAIERASAFSALAYCTKYDNIQVGPLQNACPCVLCTGNPHEVQVTIVYKGNVSGVVFRDDSNKEIVIALKGTTTNDEWARDFNIFPQPYNSLSDRPKGLKKWFKTHKDCQGCTVHMGFYEGAKLIHDNLFPKVLQMREKYPDYKLLITGHSLGGAMAPIVANEYLEEDIPVTLITFGAPKIGNRFFAQWMDSIWNTKLHYSNLQNVDSNSAFIRVSHNGDIVPLVPTRQMGYVHSGVDIYFHTKNLPMPPHSISVRDSPSHLSINSTVYINAYSELIVPEAYTKSMDSHRNYLVRMNQCNAAVAGSDVGE